MYSLPTIAPLIPSHLGYQNLPYGYLHLRNGLNAFACVAETRKMNTYDIWRNYANSSDV